MHQHQRLLGRPHDFYQYNDLGAVMNMSWARIPSYYYYYKQYQLPFTDAEFTNLFGKNLPLFGSENEDSSVQTNAAIGSGVNETFLAMGCGVVAIGEGESFSTHGVDVDNDGSEQATPGIPALGTACEGFCGVPDLLNTPEGARAAQMWWGGPTWSLIEKFFQSYRLNLTVNRRFLLVDESLHDVGMVPTPPEFIGAGDSRVPIQPFIHAVNTTMAAKNLSHAFVPVNVNVDENGASQCIPPALESVTYGHPRIVGLSNRLYTFNQPILFVPGMRFDLSFQAVEDDSQWPALRNKVTYNQTTVVDNFGATDGGCGDIITIPGGTVSLGLVLKGVSLAPQAVIEFLTKALLPQSTYEDMYSSLASPWLAQAVQKYDRTGQLSGLLKRIV